MPTNLPANFKSDAWMHVFAWRVNEVVSTSEQMGHFRDQFEEWFMRHLIRHAELIYWLRERKQHLMNARLNERLRDLFAGAPSSHSDWVAECYPGTVCGAWMPRKYTLDNKPDTSPPLPFRDHESTLWEKYAILAVLRDRVCRNVELVVPKQDSQSGTRFGVAYQALFRQIPKLTERDRPALERCLVSVCADLKVPVPAAAETAVPAVQITQNLEQTFMQIEETTNVNVLLPSNVPATGQPRAAIGEPADEDRKAPISRPSDNAIAAWRLRDLEGLKSQSKIAERMSQELGKKVQQWTVSRWLTKVDKYLLDGNVLPALPTPISKPHSIDPSKIDMGERTDGRPLHQRQNRTPNSD